MRWTGEFRSLGYYKLTVDGRVWELRYRARSRSEAAGWYLYGPEGVDVVAERMGQSVANAQRNAARFVSTFDPGSTIDAAAAKASDALWNELLEKEA